MVYFEDEQTKLNFKEDYKILFRLGHYLKPHTFGIFICLVLLFLDMALALAGPYITGIAIDKYIETKNLKGLANITLLYLIVVLSAGVVQYFRKFFVNLIGQKIMQKLAVDTFYKFQFLSLKYFGKHPVGKLVTRVTNDIHSLQELFTSGIVEGLGEILTLVGIIILMFYLNVKLTLISIVVLPLIGLTMFLFRAAIRKVYVEIRAKVAHINAFLNEHITGIKIVQLFNKEQESAREFGELSEQYRALWMKTIIYMSFFMPFVRFMGGFLIAIVLWFGGSDLMRGLLTFGTLVAFIQYAQRFFEPLQRLSDKYNVFLSAIAAAQKVYGVLDCQEIIPRAKNPVTISEKMHELSFENVTFGYDPEEAILKNVNLKIKRGESVAIVGATGSGKTTIINLLFRFYDVNAGQILIDGVNIKEYDLKSLRQNFGIVQQDVFLFSGTILDNIRLGNKSITEQEVIEAAKVVNADNFIQKLPNKYYTVLGERGVGLSTGEKQLLAFARSVALNPKIILILDEATSNIDSENEKLIQEGLAKLLKGRTALVIAHRLSTIQNVDRIIVIHKGEIKEEGSHEELIAKGKLYYDLYRFQFQMVE